MRNSPVHLVQINSVKKNGTLLEMLPSEIQPMRKRYSAVQ
jgi:hypothetical protein